jgi:flagellar biosynthesis protein FlhA
VIVSRAGAESSLGKEITSQILIQPRAIAVAAAVLFGFGLVPGLPTIPFMILAVLSGGLAYVVFQSIKESSRVQEEQKMQAEKAIPADQFDALPPLDTLAVEVGYGLIPLVDTEQDGQLLDRIRSLRRQIARELGIIVAPVHIQDNMHLKPGEYTILLKGNEVAKGELMTNYYLAMNPGNAEAEIDGIATKEPTYGLPALWIKEDAKENALAKGYTVVDLATVLTTHLSEVVKRHCHELLGRQDVQQLLDALKGTHPKVVEELVPNLLSLGGVVKVLQNLLREQIPIRDLLAILETLADWSPAIKDLDILSEHVRQALARTITKMYQSADGKIAAITLGHSAESAISEALQQTDQGSFLSMDPSLAQQLMNNLARCLEKMSSINYQPVVLCSAQIRFHFKRLVDRFLPHVVVLAYDEILNNVEIQSMDMLELNYAD